MFSDDQAVTEVSVTELSRQAPAVIAAVVGGERVIVSKHGRPAALIVSIGDGLDVMLAGSERFAMLRREARERLESGELESRDGLALASRAQAQLAQLAQQHRRMLERTLRTVARQGPREGLVSVHTSRHFAACEVSAGGTDVFVYAIGRTVDLVTALFGPTLDRAFTGRAMRAVLHGRGG